jgi:hypothetical protein
LFLQLKFGELRMKGLDTAFLNLVAQVSLLFMEISVIVNMPGKNCKEHASMSQSTKVTRDE